MNNAFYDPCRNILFGKHALPDACEEPFLGMFIIGRNIHLHIEEGKIDNGNRFSDQNNEAMLPYLSQLLSSWHEEWKE